MDNLIKRNDAVNELEDMRGYRDEDGYVMIFKSDAIDRINCISSADRPRGEWIERYGSSMGIYECSKCGNLIHSPYEDIRKKFHAYCGRCGADMRGADDE